MQSIRYQAAALFLSVMLCAGCAASGVSTQAEDPAAPAFRILTYVEDGASAPSFKTEGILQESGAATGDALPPASAVAASPDWTGTRVLKGAKGDLLLAVEARLGPTANGLKADGTFTIRQGTGAYAGAQGTGTYRALTDSKGNVREWYQGSFSVAPVPAADPAATPSSR